MIQTIKLNKLRLSPINVRTAPDEQLQIEPMAASIEAKGVLQNLLVTPAKKPRGTFEVFDGGRRWRALRLLAERGTISETDFDVPVMVLTGDDAELSETSTATNFHQLKMTPAEECRAFQHFIGTTGDIDAVAKRFGVTRRFVEGRLRGLACGADLRGAQQGCDHARHRQGLCVDREPGEAASGLEQLSVEPRHGRHHPPRDRQRDAEGERPDRGAGRRGAVSRRRRQDRWGSFHRRQ